MLSARKLVASVFWHRKGVLMVELIQHGTTVTSEAYCETLKNCVGLVIQNKRRGMLTSGVVLFHDNAGLHTAAHTGEMLEHFNWELFGYPPYSPDLALSNYRLFAYLKNWLGSQRFSSNEELMEVVKTWLSSQAADCFDTGIQKLIPRCNMWLSCGGDYIEK
jgi:histone-lysine N-methyltransferase SETMAR